MIKAEELIKLISSNPEKYKDEINQMLAEASMIDYIETVWHELEPATVFKHGWHIDCIVDHLTAVLNGEINRLLLNVPPGSAKPVSENSIVVTTAATKRLKDVVVGDKILTHTGNFRRVQAVHKQGNLPVLKIKTEKGRELILAYDHPVLTKRGWIQAQKLTLDDFVHTVTHIVNFGWDRLIGIEEFGIEPCRCLTVEEDHSFVANEISVHNSLLSEVFFPSWVWGPKGQPWKQFLGFSYSQRLAERDNVKCRNLIKSPTYQRLWGDVFQLSRSENAKKKFSNDKNGFKEVSSIGGTVTGLRGDIVMIDDPHSVSQGDSDADMKTALNWFNESLPTRLNDPATSAIVVIMQRINEGDISGEILNKELGYTHVMIPMEFEPERRCYTIIHPGGHKAPDNSLYLWDQRENEGDLMWPEHFPREVVDKLKTQLGAYASAGQLQQRPVPREGAMFKVKDLKHIPLKDVPEGFEIRGWDLAGSSSSKSPFTAGVKLRFDSLGNFYIMDVVRFRGEERRVVSVMQETAMNDGKDCIQDFPQDPGQAGKGQAVYITEQLAGFVVRSSLETGNKVLRAEAVSSQASVGKMFIVNGPWNKDFEKELTTFPGCRFKDQIDALSRAFHCGFSMVERRSEGNICAPISV